MRYVFGQDKQENPKKLWPFGYTVRIYVAVLEAGGKRCDIETSGQSNHGSLETLL